MEQTIKTEQCKIETVFPSKPLASKTIKIHGNPFPIKLEHLSDNYDNEPVDNLLLPILQPHKLQRRPKGLIKIEVVDDDSMSTDLLIAKERSQSTETVQKNSPKLDNIHAGNESFYKNGMYVNVLECNEKDIKHEPDLLIHTDPIHLKNTEQNKRTNKNSNKQKAVSQKRQSKKSRQIKQHNQCFNVTNNSKEIEKEKRLSQFKCEWCTDEFQTIPQLHAHTLLIHSKPYACNDCPKSFSNYHFYQIHTTIHNDLVNDRPKCNVCNRNFATIDHLQQHMFIHLRQKPHRCPICSQGFLQSACLTIHVEKCRRRRAQKMLSCKICFEAYATPTLLMVHLATHCTERTPRPYYCSLCLVPFWCARYFVRHMIGHAGVKPYICDICNEDFGTRKEVKKHIISMHVDACE